MRCQITFMFRSRHRLFFLYIVGICWFSLMVVGWQGDNDIIIRTNLNLKKNDLICKLVNKSSKIFWCWLIILFVSYTMCIYNYTCCILYIWVCMSIRIIFCTIVLHFFYNLLIFFKKNNFNSHYITIIHNWPRIKL